MIQLDKKAEETRRMSEKADVADRRIQELQDGLKRDEALLDMYENPMWETFVEKVLLPEKGRLAERRMSIPIDHKEDHILIGGQFLQADLYSKSKASLIRNIDEALNELELRRGQLESARSKLGKLDK